MVAYQALLLATSVLAVSPIPPVKGVTPDSLPNVFFVELNGENRAPDCAKYVIDKLAARGVTADRLSWRTNYNLGEYGNICSFAINGDRTPVFDLPGVQLTAVQKIEPIKPKVSTAKATSNEAIHELTGVTQTREKYGLTGKGVRVAVVDSGVDYLHPALGGGFGKGFVVTYGYDLVGDFYNGTDSSTIPDEDPLDNCSDDSHGTHVAGIVAADTSRVQDNALKSAVNFTGAAPNAEIGAYRVFSCNGGGSGTDIIAAAIYKAAYDGSHIINLSLGGGPTYVESASSVACEKVNKLGHYCVSANGNDGASGEYTAGSPGISRGGFGIGSTDNSELIQAYVSVDGEQFAVNFGSAYGSPFPSNFSLSDIVVSSKNAEIDNILSDGVQITEDVAGKIVLVRWGPSENGGSKTRCDGVYNKNGTACILYGHTDDMSGIFGSSFIPSAFIARAAGLKIRSAIEAGNPVNAVIHPELVGKIPGPTGGTLSAFSSHGLDLDLFIKPDITAIGGNVFSTISRHASKGASPYATYSGTSMASPNFAGILALYLEHKMKTSSGTDFESVKARFQNTATPMKVFKSEDIESAAGQGAGLVNIFNALNIESRVTPGSISLNDTVRMQKSYTIQIYNDAKVATDYTLSTLDASMISPFAPEDDAIQVREKTVRANVHATVKFSETKFTLGPFDSKQVTVQFIPPESNEKWPIYSGYLIVSNSRDEIMRIPYAGVLGDWNEAPIFVRYSPAMSEALGNEVSTGAFDEQFQLLTRVNLTSGAIILPILATNTRNAAIDLVPLDVNEEDFIALGLDPKNLPSPFLYDMNGAALGLFIGEASRHTAVNGQSVSVPAPYAWYGEVGYNSTLLPPGKYKLKFYGLKHFGKTDTKGDIDSTDVSQFDIVEQEFEVYYGAAIDKPSNDTVTTTTVAVTVTTSDIATSTAVIATTIVDGTTIHYTSTIAPTTTVVNGTSHYTSTTVDGNGSYASTTTYGIVTTADHYTYTSTSNGPHYTINPSSPYSAYSAPSGPAYHQILPAPAPYKPGPIQTPDVTVASPQVIPAPVQSELPSLEQNHGNSSTPYDNANPSAAKSLFTGFHGFILAFLLHLLK